MKDILFLEPVLKEAIWGGSRLGLDYGYDIPSNHTGECWAVSAHENGDCIVRSNHYKEVSLSTLWKNHRELFGNLEGDKFPLLVKIIDAKQDLSIQVHPDNHYAKVNENGALGKTECWYILDCDEDASIVVGHHAKDKEELKKMIDLKQWNELIQVLPVKKGDFFQIEPGTVHAIKGGTVILETQQNSDITYRLYDYDRIWDGKPRELHISKSIDVIGCPHQEVMIDRTVSVQGDARIENLVQCEYYQVKKIDVNGTKEFIQTEPFSIVSVIEGIGTIDGTAINKGDHFILPDGYGSFVISGTVSFMISTV